VPWCFRCESCDFQIADLPAQVDGPDDSMNEFKRAIALKNLRVLNFRKIVAAMLESQKSNTTVLDVGCAHGWFLQEAQSKGLQTVGIEPAKKNLQQVIDFSFLGDVREGFFPQALSLEEKFDFIVFNDVFEHLPDIEVAIKSCHQHLKPGGQLILNLPSSHGIFYRIATWLSCLGINGPFERLWQKAFPSPHLTYFTPRQLRAFVRPHGFKPIKTIPLQIITLSGLWERLRFDKSSSVLKSVFLWVAITLLMPALILLPSDIHCEFFEKI
jgi:SAM-dependent methyltransferase